MKGFLVAVVLLALSCACIGDDVKDCSAADWAAFKAAYKRHYATTKEEDVRHTIFCVNLELVREHNARYKNGEVSWEMGINMFSDWTLEELSYLKGFNPSAHTPKNANNSTEGGNTENV